MSKKFCATCGANVMQKFLKCPSCGGSDWSIGPVTVRKLSTSAGGPPVKLSAWEVMPYVAKKTFDPHGRASRSEYWLFILFQTLILTALVLAGIWSGFRYEDSAPTILIVIVLACFYIWVAISVISLSIRRLHDMDFSGWWALALYFWSPLLSAVQISFPDLTGVILVLNAAISIGVVVFFCQQGTRGSNRFGEEPAYFV
jgi:uncharacterized membrane protein YhaH (DUF805 family)